MRQHRATSNDQAAHLPGRRLLPRAGFAVVGAAVVALDIYYMWLVQDQDGIGPHDPRRLFFIIYLGV